MNGKLPLFFKETIEAMLNLTIFDQCRFLVRMFYYVVTPSYPDVVLNKRRNTKICTVVENRHLALDQERPFLYTHSD